MYVAADGVIAVMAGIDIMVAVAVAIVCWLFWAVITIVIAARMGGDANIVEPLSLFTSE